MKARNLVLPVLTLLSMLVGLYMIVAYAPVEAEQGVVQKIFYFHVPSAWIAFFAFFVVFLYSFRYLTTHDRRYDIRAHVAAELGVMFCTLVLITGPIWAKPIWGIWWTWDARLTLTLVLWLIYVAYLMLRHYVDSSEKRATLSAIVGIIGFIDVPLVYFAIRWWRTQHPAPVLMGGEDSGMPSEMRLTLLACTVAFTFLYFYLYKRRVAIEEMREELDELHQLHDDMIHASKGVAR
jgi:heme exporter protein C